MRDQCERLTSKSLQLEGEHEVAADLVIGYGLAMAQNQPKQRISPLPLPPASNPGTTHHPLEAAEPYTPSGREYAAHAQAPYEYYTHAYRTRTYE